LDEGGDEREVSSYLVFTEESGYLAAMVFIFPETISRLPTRFEIEMFGPSMYFVVEDGLFFLSF
jgi:hypothetical protein